MKFYNYFCLLFCLTCGLLWNVYLLVAEKLYLYWFLLLTDSRVGWSRLFFLFVLVFFFLFWLFLWFEYLSLCLKFELVRAFWYPVIENFFGFWQYIESFFDHFWEVLFDNGQVKEYGQVKKKSLKLYLLNMHCILQYV